MEDQAFEDLMRVLRERYPDVLSVDISHVGAHLIHVNHRSPTCYATLYKIKPPARAEGFMSDPDIKQGPWPHVWPIASTGALGAPISVPKRTRMARLRRWFRRA